MLINSELKNYNLVNGIYVIIQILTKLLFSFFNVLLKFYISFRYTVHWLDVYIVSEVIPRLLYHPSGSTPSYYITIDYVPFAALYVPVTIS